MEDCMKEICKIKLGLSCCSQTFQVNHLLSERHFFLLHFNPIHSYQESFISIFRIKNSTFDFSLFYYCEMIYIAYLYITYFQEGIRTLIGKASISYIRVRVVRVVGPVVCVYGIDTGTIHTCRSVDLILLPSSILSHPPAGRLAILPGN